MSRRNSSCNNVLEILNLFSSILKGVKFVLTQIIEFLSLTLCAFSMSERLSH